MRITAEMAALIRIYRGRFILTGKAKELLKKESLAGLYLTLFMAYVEEYNWCYLDRYPEIDFIQQSWVFSLWLLHCHGDEEPEQQFYEDKYNRAFPALVEQVGDSPYRSGIDTVKGAYTLRTFHRFLVMFGLIECRKQNQTDSVDNYWIKTTPLLSQLVTFSV